MIRIQIVHFIMYAQLYHLIIIIIMYFKHRSN